MTDRTQKEDKPGGSASTAHDCHPQSMADASRNQPIVQQIYNIQQVNANSLAMGQAHLTTNDINCSSAVTSNNSHTADDVAAAASAASSSTDQKQQPTKDQKEDKKTALIREINRISWRKTSCNVTEEFKHIQLVEPQFQVHPQMKISKDYYRGGYVKYQEIEEEVEVSRFLRRKKRIVNKYQLQKEKGFAASSEYANWVDVTIESLLNSFQKSANERKNGKVPVTAIVGSAGSGKTTLLRRIAKKTMEDNELTHENNFFSPSESQFNFVHYVELKGKLCKDKLTPAEFLFGGCFHDASKAQDAYDHLRKYESKQILFFDGLDQAMFDIPETSTYNIEEQEKADAGTILCGILSGRLLPHIKIVFTTREFKLSTLPGNAQPDEIIALTGFKYEDAKNLFITLVGSEGNDHWMKINKFSKRLLNLISIPVFLILTAIVTAKDPKKPPPKTVTELFNRIISSLHQLDNIQERQQINEVISKLKVMAHNGMKEGRVVFTEKDLEEVGLKMTDVRDIMMKVPGNSTLTRNFMEGQLLLFFCHQSIQEFLSASFVSEMKSSQFKSFCKTYFKQNRWSVVQSFTCGIVFQATPDSMHQVSERERKQKILSKIIRKNIQSCEKFELIELLSAIFETNDENLIRSCTARIDLSDTPLSRDAAHLFSTFLGGHNKFDLVNLRNCEIDDNLMTIMGENLNGMDVQINCLYLYGNNFTNVGLNCFLRSTVVDELGIHTNKDFQTESPYLHNVNVTVNVDGIFNFTRSGNDFEFDHHFIKGSFELESRKLVVTNNEVTGLFFENFVKISKFLKPASIEFLHDPVRSKHYLQWHFMTGLFYVTQKHELKFQIADVLLDCRWNKASVDPSMKCIVDPSSIISFVCYFNVQTLDLVVYDRTTFTQEDALTVMQSELSQLNCKLKVSWYLEINSDGRLLNKIPTIQRNQDENLRLRVHISSVVSIEPIVSVIEKCKLKTLVLVFMGKDIIPHSEKRRVSEAADRFSIKLEFRYHRGAAQDAWYYADSNHSLGYRYI